METLERYGRSEVGRRTKTSRSSGSLVINLNAEINRVMAASVIEHARALDITTPEALTRAWWFYLASYEKAVAQEVSR